MKRSMNMVLGVALTVLVAMPAWAGSAASVNQTGDGAFSLVIQRNGKPANVTTATTPGAQWMLNKKARAAVKQATRPRSAATGRPGGRASVCTPRSGYGTAFVGQNGIGNAASVTQKGANNAAGIVQNGNGNKSHIVQKGNGHLAETIQDGNNNTAYVIQKC